MLQIAESILPKLVSKDIDLRPVEPHIYTVLPNIEVDSSYEKKFGNIYDWVACNPIYNRLIWGYSTSKFASLTSYALKSSKKVILDLGCGSLAFTSKEYLKYSECPVILLDQSLKLLRIAKSRLLKLNGKFPENMIFLQADALQLPFKSNSFDTIIVLNLLHVLSDIRKLLIDLKDILVEDGRIYFTTLVKSGRIADNYLKIWEKVGEVIARDIKQLQSFFNKEEMPIKYEINGNMAFIYYERNHN